MGRPPEHLVHGLGGGQEGKYVQRCATARGSVGGGAAGIGGAVGCEAGARGVGGEEVGEKHKELVQPTVCVRGSKWQM